MLKRLRATLTARSTVLVLLLALAAAMLVAALVPQGGLDVAPGASGGAAARPTPGGAVRLLGLDHVFSTPWFAAIALAFVASLTLSTLEQTRAASARMRRPPGEGVGAPSALSAAELERVLSRERYRRVASVPGRARYVRQWQGYWGNPLLHAGMTITALFAVVYVLTEHRAILHLISGRTNPFPEGSVPARRGLLARDLPVPAEIDVRGVEPTFGANDQLVDLGSDLILTDSKGRSSELRVAVNAYGRYRGAIVYQLVKYGHAFGLELSEPGGAPVDLPIEMAFPEKRGSASYVNWPLEGGRILKAKYYASADKSQLVSDRPELVLRLQEGERILGEATLLEGQSAPLGAWTVRLASVGWWTEILFEGSLGTSGIFAGFAILLLGGALVFFAVPREVVVSEGPEGCTVWWRATRFPDMFRDEGERVLSRCAGGRPQ